VFDTLRNTSTNFVDAIIHDQSVINSRPTNTQPSASTSDDKGSRMELNDEETMRKDERMSDHGRYFICRPDGGHGVPIGGDSPASALGTTVQFASGSMAPSSRSMSDATLGSSAQSSAMTSMTTTGAPTQSDLSGGLLSHPLDSAESDVPSPPTDSCVAILSTSSTLVTHEHQRSVT
jgi:hypothetical protein